MPRYDSAGKNRSAMVHATRKHTCSLCGQTGYGNGFASSHGRAHVRQGEAVELVKHYDIYPPSSSRLFLAPGDKRIERFLLEGYQIEEAR